jgi:UDP-2,4-diacetamido-2,4,6-trideoxy-beta-L-altropyranose hydrolase
MMFRAIILTEGGTQWGMGHLHRCAAYAEELASNNWMVEWRVCGDELVQQFLQSLTGKLETWWESTSLDNELNVFQVAIIDSYHAPLSVYDAIAERVPRCLYLDDEARLTYPRGYVVNSAPNAETLPYSFGAETKLLAGPKYHALRSEFRDEYNRCVKDEIQNILIVMGGSDLHELSPFVTEQTRCIYPNARIQVIIPNALQREKWRGLGSDSTKLLGNQSALEMRTLMEWADLCISAAGQTLYELCRMGLPAVTIGVADNQRRLVEGFKAEKLILFSGWWSDAKLAQHLRNTLEQVKALSVRQSLAQKGQLLLDGQGVTNSIARLLGA